MAREAEYLGELKKAIEQKYRCRAAHRETVLVTEKMEKDEIVWKGYVEVFDLMGRWNANRCYAWQHIGPDGIQIFTVLESPFVDSPQRAIKAAIFANAQPPVVKQTEDLEQLKKRIEAGKKALYDAEIHMEDLKAIIQTCRDNREPRIPKRDSPEP